ncbi:MAG: periplasmic heavy metal sensor, partial [Verrucomicrobiota bacterium]
MSTTRGLICAMAIAMLTAGVAGPASGETNAAAQRPHKGKGFGGRFMAEFEQLNLTADQSQQIASIMKLDQESMKAAMTKAQETREALNRQTQAGPFDEQSVRAACKKA